MFSAQTEGTQTLHFDEMIMSVVLSKSDTNFRQIRDLTLIYQRFHREQILINPGKESQY